MAGLCSRAFFSPHIASYYGWIQRFKPPARSGTRGAGAPSLPEAQAHLLHVDAFILVARQRFPHPHGLVAAARGQQAARWVPRHAFHLVLVALQHCHLQASTAACAVGIHWRLLTNFTPPARLLLKATRSFKQPWCVSLVPSHFARDSRAGRRAQQTFCLATLELASGCARSCQTRSSC